jgi:hypothetical protein
VSPYREKCEGSRESGDESGDHRDTSVVTDTERA